MDLEPFNRINPCGYQGLKTTQLKDLGCDTSYDQVIEDLLGHLQTLLTTRSAPQ
jgi:lipoyl(octanoyl) transferase